MTNPQHYTPRSKYAVPQPTHAQQAKEYRRTIALLYMRMEIAKAAIEGRLDSSLEDLMRKVKR